MRTQMQTVTQAESALNSHLNQTFNYMAAGVGLSGVVAYFTINTPALLAIAAGGGFIWMIGLLILAFTLQSIVFKLQPAAGLAVFAGYSAFMGFAFSPLVAQYTGSSVASAFGVAALMFAGTAAYGYFTKRSLAGIGTFLVMGLWGLLAVALGTMVAGMFGVQVGMMQTVINLIAVPLFAGLTAYEVNNIRETFAQYGRDELLRSRLAILQATSLYVSFINMFLSLLQLLGNRQE
ncbi:MAG: Bax inhibitor-1/YccA family protein [Proteobacteria bacterium]|nr:Bax inhibitor-1/YccA family protein [Pseudomonadota bacterium]NBX86529.1 Bax inhibitor-1/YccA family protein [Pseudomonadota bacterium]